MYGLRIKTLCFKSSCVYDDFIGTAKTVLTQKHREGLRKLLGFKFKKNSRYNLPDKRLKMLEKMIRGRAKLLLDKWDSLNNCWEPLGSSKDEAYKMFDFFKKKQ